MHPSPHLHSSQPPPRIAVVPYSDAWPARFEELAKPIRSAIGSLALTIEHVGSTAVPNLASKPIIDIDIVVSAPQDSIKVIDCLTTLGYAHRGDLGIAGREAFFHPEDLPRHHLYVCLADGSALANHIAVRDYLRKHPDVASAYGALKIQLAIQCAEDPDGYTEGKSAFLRQILTDSGFPIDTLDAIEAMNRRPTAQ